MVDSTVSARRIELVGLCLRFCLPWSKVRELGKFLAFNIIVTASSVITNGLTAVTLSELSFHL